MKSQAQCRYLSLAEYLLEEEQSVLKHEYVDGETYAMSGASRRHNQIASNMHLLAGNAVKRTHDCQVFGPAMKLYVEARNSIYYPDLSASCDPTDRNERYLTRPCFLLEVLSPSTARTDRREKRTSYETLASLHEYFIVDQDRMRVDVYRRQANVWLAFVFRWPEDVVEVSCLHLQITLAEIYEGVELPCPGVAEENAPHYFEVMSAPV